MSLTVTDGRLGGAVTVSVLRTGSNCLEEAPLYPLFTGDIL
jgi:hypothetical protein